MTTNAELMQISYEIKKNTQELHEIRQELFVFRKKLIDTLREIKYDYIKRTE